MASAGTRVRGLWRRLVRAYHLACVRDDAVTHGVAAPSGVWFCGTCRRVMLELSALCEHLRAEHAAS